MFWNSTRKRRLGLGIAAMLSVGALLASCASGGNSVADNGDADSGAEAFTGEPIRIGALFPISGSLALLGEESWRGVQVAVNEVNANGGIDGRRVDIEFADVPDVNAAGSESRRLLDSEGIDLVVGSYSSGLALAGSEVYARGGGTYVELGAVTMDYNTRGYDGVLRTNPNASYQAGAQVDFIENWVADALGKDKSELKVLYVHEDSAYGSSLSRSFAELAGGVGITNVSQLPYSSDSTDLTSTVLSIGQAKPDVVIAVSYASDAILLTRQMVENGVKVPVFHGSGGGHTIAGYGDTLGELADYTFNVDFPQLNINPEATPGLEEFQVLYEEVFGEPSTSGYSLANYAGMQIVFDILRETKGDTTRAAVMDAAKGLDQEMGTTATGWGVKFDDAGQNERVAMYITQWRDGKLLTVWPENVAVQDPELAPTN